MKAVTFNEYGGPEVLSIQDIPVPAIAADEVLIQVAATSFNAVDALIRAGKLKDVFPITFPAIPGIDAAGVISQVGSSVTSWKVGDRVYGMLPLTKSGGSAEYVVAKADGLAAVPTTITIQDAATLPAVGNTAWQALFEHLDLQSGQRILIVGASGSVGALAIQLAKWKGAYVIATSSHRHMDLVETLGADEVIDHRKTDWQLKLKDKVDAILLLAYLPEDLVNTLIGYLTPNGALVSTTIAPDAAFAAKAGVKAVRMDARNDVWVLQQLAQLVDAGTLHARVRAAVLIEELPLVHEQFENGHVHGKVKITVNDTL